MPSTTTFEAIREQYLRKVVTITPSILSGDLFHRPNIRIPLRDWAIKSAGSQCFRAIEMRLDSVLEEPHTMDPSAYERNDSATLVIAYPADLSMYWKDDQDADMDNFEDVINSDSNQVRDVLTSTGNLLAGQNAMRVAGRRTDRTDDAIWFHEIDIVTIYTVSQTLT